MNKRERILAGAVAALVAVWGGNKLYGRYRNAIDTRNAQVQSAKARLADASLTLTKGRSALKQMTKLQERSLPSDLEKARSLYKAWLLTKAKNTGVTVTDIKQAPKTKTNPQYKAIGYQIEADGALSNVVSLLYEFYRSPLLHQITKLKLTRPVGAPQMQVSLEVEALCLPLATSANDLPEGDSKRPKLASVGEYQKVLGERDIATVYTAPRPPAPPNSAPGAPPKFNEAEMARFTASVNSGAGMQAWIYVLPTGEMLHVVAGDAVKIGNIDGKIESVEARSLILKTADKRYLVRLGDYLLKGQELDAEGNPKPSPAAEPPKS
jgi:hypothetical protein